MIEHLKFASGLMALPVKLREAAIDLSMWITHMPKDKADRVLQLLRHPEALKGVFEDMAPLQEEEAVYLRHIVGLTTNGTASAEPVAGNGKTRIADLPARDTSANFVNRVRRLLLKVPVGAEFTSDWVKKKTKATNLEVARATRQLRKFDGALRYKTDGKKRIRGVFIKTRKADMVCKAYLVGTRPNGVKKGRKKRVHK